MTSDLCPCHSQQKYAECCGPYHSGKVPKTAAALMRSRYAAYALKLADYVVTTTHPKSSQYNKNTAAWKQSIEGFSQTTNFLSLTILDQSERGDKATVTFKAGLIQALKDVSFTERSTFQKEKGRWLYLSGEIVDATNDFQI